MLPWKDKDQKLLPWKQFGQVAAAGAGASFSAAAGGAVPSSCKESWGVGVQGAPTSRLEFFSVPYCQIVVLVLPDWKALQPRGDCRQPHVLGSSCVCPCCPHRDALGGLSILEINSITSALSKLFSSMKSMSQISPGLIERCINAVHQLELGAAGLALAII